MYKANFAITYSLNGLERKKGENRNKNLRRSGTLTNRFHFAVRLYSDTNAQMTSKHGKNKDVRYEPQASSVTDVLTMF